MKEHECVFTELISFTVDRFQKHDFAPAQHFVCVMVLVGPGYDLGPGLHGTKVCAAQRGATKAA